MEYKNTTTEKKSSYKKHIDSEKLVERKLVEACRLKGGMCIKLLTYQFIGLPDRMCLFPGGYTVFVELKTTGQKPRKIQTIVHDMLRKLGFRVEILDTVEGVEKFIQNVDI